MTGWENPISIVFDGARAAVGRVLGFFVACWVGAGVVLASVDHPLPMGCSPFTVPVYWLGGVVVGLAQGWGLLAYFALFAMLAGLMQTERRALAICFLATLVQAAETARMLLQWGAPVRWWVLTPLMALVLSAGGGGYWLARQGARLRAQRRFRRNMGFCVACGYDLRASIVAGHAACPECGAEVAPYTVRVVRERHAGGAAIGEVHPPGPAA